MGKHEAPPFRMIIQGGRLVPASAYDAERLDTYRNGMEVRVRLTEDRDRVMNRKWWAVLNRAVKECKTPWKTAQEASEAIKLAIGVVNLTKTVGGEYMAYPKSLTELDDPELTEAVEQMIEVVYRVTGVDPAEWKKQIAHIRDEEPSSSAASDDDAGSDQAPGSSPDAGAADPTASNGEAETGGNEGQHGAIPSPVSELTDEQRVRKALLEECAEAILRAATHAKAEARAGEVEKAAAAWRNELPNDHDFIARCEETARRVIAQPANKDQADDYLKSLAMKRARAS